MDQTTETFLRIEAIFHEALGAPESTRNELIATLCRGDRTLETEVYSLLGACEAEETASALRRSHPESAPESASEPRRIGPYLLDRLLGRGGMGAVYLAHRADGQFEQKLAIKLIDLPLATDIFRERFRQERQILAALQHPFIARLLDGGVTPDGDLYVAMEYVDGVPIHRFCEGQKLSVQQRLALFVQVCEAVQFAHQNLIVHRDLKPDNILVAEDGTPRLLDFGTAKLLSPSLANPGSELTREGFQSFTPQYASPEQVLGNPITTASDTYSLGVLLYRLLTGTLPYELKELTTAEMLRVICQEAPRWPAYESISHKRLDADLEAILQKALRKEPQERYRTAEQLASDVRAHLDGKPVAARRGTLHYRSVKFIRRHRVGIAAAALLAVTAAFGVAGVLWQARVANEERRKADARSADLRQLSNSLLSELDEAIKQLPGSTGAQKLLVTRVLEHLDRMGKDAEGDRLTQLDLADAYTRLGDMQGNAYDQNLGDPAGALVSIGKALDFAERLTASDPNDLDAVRALARAQEARSEVLFTSSRTQEAIVSMRAAVASYDRLIQPATTHPSLIGEAAAANGTLGDELGQSGTASLADSGAALAAYRQAMTLDKRSLGIDPEFLRARRGYAIMLMKVASIEMETDPAQALKDFEDALHRIDALPSSDQGTLTTMRFRALLVRKDADALVELGEYSRAFPLFAQSVQTQRKLAAADPQDLRAQADLEVMLDDEAIGYETAANPALAAPGNNRLQNLAAADGLLTQIVTITEKMLRQAPSNEDWRAALADAQVRLATDQSILHKPGDSTALAKAGLASFKEMTRRDQASASLLDQAANAFLTVEPASLQDAGYATECAERAVALSRRQRPYLLLTLAQAYGASGRGDKSHSIAEEGLSLLPSLPPGNVKPNMRKLLEIEVRPGQ